MPLITPTPARTRGRLALAACLLVAAAAPAQRAEAESVESGGVDDAIGCESVACIDDQTFVLGTLPFAPVTGGVHVDQGGPTLSFNLSVSSVSLVETVPGTEDNGVAEVEFTDLNYVATNLTLTEGSPGSGSFSIDFDQTASLDGDQTQRNDGGAAVNGTPAAFTANDVQVTGNCLFSDPESASCSFTFGTHGFGLSVGDPTPAPRFFGHTMSLVVCVSGCGVPVPAMGPAGRAALIALLLTLAHVVRLRPQRRA